VVELNPCQAHVDSSGQRVWQSSAIILAAGLATLGLMLQVSASEIAAAVITTAFAIGAIVVLGSWQYLIGRERALQKSSINRMTELEGRLQFRRELLIKSADDSYREFPLIGTTTTDWLIGIGRLVQAGWVVIALWLSHLRRAP
jgi:hypothetical protein